MARTSKGNSYLKYSLLLICGCQGGGGRGREGVGGWGQQMQLIIRRMDTQQGPTVEHRELYPISCDKPSWKRILKNECMYMYT